MREIKFRAWDAKSHEMVFNVNVNDGKPVKPGYQWFNSQNTVRDSKLMQYTGLKDKNGTDIYEGDIVETHDQNNIIEYQHGSFMLIGLHEDRYERNYSYLYHHLIDSTIPDMEGSRFDGITTTLEVIGNIYQNPDLLERS